jgi:hypothetical protein
MWTCQALLDDGMQDIDLESADKSARKIVPVQKRPEKWIIRKGDKAPDIRKSRRVPSVRCREKIRKLAARLAQSDSEEEDEHVDSTNCNQMMDIVLHDDDDGDDRGRDHTPGIPQVDGNYTLLAQDVFSAADIDYYTHPRQIWDEFSL